MPNAFLTKTIATHYGTGGGANYVGDRWADPANTPTRSDGRSSGRSGSSSTSTT
ncbi:hypothetical protein [Sphingomonas sp.]|uniref:hypothetical protein n=1 Tax=Sphingomonas sp. TaxID=28214 RepID=UPI003B009B46